MNIIKKHWFNDIIIRDDLAWGFNKEGMLKCSKSDRQWVHFLGTIDKQQYYFKRISRAKRRPRLFG